MSLAPYNPDRLPRIEFPAEPGLVELYDLAWKLAWQHIKEHPQMPQSPYMDEGFADDRIWIWDTCFMVNFCKYAPEVFPGAVSLNNFYRPLLDNAATAMPIHHPDNPPLPAWAEHACYRITADRERMQRVLVEHRYLQRFYDYFDNLRPGNQPSHTIWKVFAERTEMGYHWLGGSSGMDNTPRGGVTRDEADADATYRKILWVDALAQQALNALNISELAEEFGLPGDAAEFRARYQRSSQLLNQYYWNEEDGFYYDIEAAPPHRQIRVKTPASFWCMLAGVCSPEQAARMAAMADDPAIFGGVIPWPSVSRSSPDFCPDGCYWRGGVWLPLAYMAIKALERYGFYDTADRLAEALVRHQLNTYRSYEPHTIWEAYSPTEARPSTTRNINGTGIVRKDFCGWSALGPICLLIENVIGLSIDGVRQTVNWRLRHRTRHGVHALRIGQNTVSLVYDGCSTIEVQTTLPLRLTVNDCIHTLCAGRARIPAKR